MSEELRNWGIRVVGGSPLSRHLQTAEQKAVKVRIDASGRRVVGYVELAAGENRISDRLNNADPFLSVRSDEPGGDTGRSWAIHKDAVSYVVALEEPAPVGSFRSRMYRSFRLARPIFPPPVVKGEFRRVTIELMQPTTMVTAELFVPDGSTIEVVLNDSPRFINLKNVSFGDDPEVFTYLALARNQSRFWEALPANGTEDKESSGQ